MSMPVPSPMNRFWKYLHGDLHIVKFRMQVRCSCSVCHQHNILSQYLSRDKYETKIMCHSLSCLFFLLFFLCSDQTRIYLHILLWAGEVLKDCLYHAMLWIKAFDWTRLESQVKWSQTRVYLHIAFFFGQGKSARHWTNSLSHSQSWGQKYRQDCQKHRNKKTQEIHWRNFTLKKLWTEFPNIIVV